MSAPSSSRRSPCLFSPRQEFFSVPPLRPPPGQMLAAFAFPRCISAGPLCGLLLPLWPRPGPHLPLGGHRALAPASSPLAPCRNGGRKSKARVWHNPGTPQPVDGVSPPLQAQHSPRRHRCIAAGRGQSPAGCSAWEGPVAAVGCCILVDHGSQRWGQKSFEWRRRVIALATAGCASPAPACRAEGSPRLLPYRSPSPRRSGSFFPSWALLAPFMPRSSPCPG